MTYLNVIFIVLYMFWGKMRALVFYISFLIFLYFLYFISYIFFYVFIFLLYSYYISFLFLLYFLEFLVTTLKLIYDMSIPIALHRIYFKLE